MSFLKWIIEINSNPKS